MKEAVVATGGIVTIRDAPIPVPKENEVLIKVIVSGTNPKDWKYPDWRPDLGPINQGDDFSGYVEAIGSKVSEFKKGDKVAAMHHMLAPAGSFAEYAIAPESTVFHLSSGTSFEEAATIPLAALTAALGLYQRLSLPLPWNPTEQPLPLVIYGGATAVGAFAIKLASLSSIHPLIVMAGKGGPFVETLIDRSKGDTIVDYRQDNTSINKEILNSAKGVPIKYAFDAVCERGSIMNSISVLEQPAKITTVLPAVEDDKIPEKVTLSQIDISSVFNPPTAGKVLEDEVFASAFTRFIGLGLKRGWFSGHPFEVRQGGLGALQEVLGDLRQGKASAVKYVVRVCEE